jgi:hypothetical protein
MDDFSSTTTATILFPGTPGASKTGSVIVSLRSAGGIFLICFLCSFFLGSPLGELFHLIFFTFFALFRLRLRFLLHSVYHRSHLWAWGDRSL